MLQYYQLWTVATGVQVVVGWVHHKALDPQVTKTHKNNKKQQTGKKVEAGIKE